MIKATLIVISSTALVIIALRLHPGTAALHHFAKPETYSVTQVDSIVVEKASRRLTVYFSHQAVKTYNIALGRNPVGDKQYQGDMRTPEGLYFIDGKNPNSTCYKNLGISYPNETDRAQGKKLGKSPGGDIKIHGILNGYGHLGKAHLFNDWTYGCIAVTDEEMDELYYATPIGTPILILP